MKFVVRFFLGLFLLFGCDDNSSAENGNKKVSSCSECSDSQVCAAYIRMVEGPDYYCKDIPKECVNDVSCDCLGEDVCQGLYDACDDTAEGVNCACINC